MDNGKKQELTDTELEKGKISALCHLAGLPFIAAGFPAMIVVGTRHGFTTAMIGSKETLTDEELDFEFKLVQGLLSAFDEATDEDIGRLAEIAGTLLKRKTDKLTAEAATDTGVTEEAHNG